MHSCWLLFQCQLHDDTTVWLTKEELLKQSADIKARLQQAFVMSRHGLGSIARTSAVNMTPSSLGVLAPFIQCTVSEACQAVMCLHPCRRAVFGHKAVCQ